MFSPSNISEIELHIRLDEVQLVGFLSLMVCDITHYILQMVHTRKTAFKIQYNTVLIVIVMLLISLEYNLSEI